MPVKFQIPDSSFHTTTKSNSPTNHKLNTIKQSVMVNKQIVGAHINTQNSALSFSGTVIG